MLDSQGFVRLMLAWHCFCSQIGTYSHVDSKAALYPRTFKFIYNYKGTPLLLCVLVSIYNCTFLTVWKLQSAWVQGWFWRQSSHGTIFAYYRSSNKMPLVFKEYSVFVFLGRNIQFLYFLEQDNWSQFKIFHYHATNVVYMTLVLYLSKYPHLV